MMSLLYTSSVYLEKLQKVFRYTCNSIARALLYTVGTHLMWEIMTMLLRGSANYIAEAKRVCMIDANPVRDEFPSPRVLNTHYRLDVLPSQFRDRKTVWGKINYFLRLKYIR